MKNTGNNERDMKKWDTSWGCNLEKYNWNLRKRPQKSDIKLEIKSKIEQL